MAKVIYKKTILTAVGLVSGVLLLAAGNDLVIKGRAAAALPFAGAGCLIMLLLSCRTAKIIDAKLAESHLSGFDWLIATFVLTISVCFRFYLFPHFGQEIGDLNGRFLSVLWEMIHGKFRFPYLHWSMENDEALPVYLYLPVAFFSRCDWPAIRLFHTLFFSFFPCFITVYLIKISGRLAGFTAGMILATSRYFILAGLEVFRNRYALSMAAIIIAAMLVFCEAHRRSLRRLIAAGCMIGLSFFLVSHCVPMAAAWMSAFVWVSLRGNGPRCIKILVPGIVTLILVIPLVIFHFHHPDISAHKSDRFIWNCHDLESNPGIIRDQIRNVLSVIVIDAEGMRQAAHSVPFLPFPLPALTIAGMILMIHRSRHPHYVMIFLSFFFYILWLFAIDFRAYTSFYYEPFLLMSILIIGIGLQQAIDKMTNGTVFKNKLRGLLILLLISIGIGGINIPILLRTPSNYSDLDLYGDMYAVFERFSAARGSIIYFDNSMWDRTWEGTFHSFVFMMEKFNITPRFFDEGTSGMQLILSPDKMELFKAPEDPVFFMSYGNHTPVPDAAREQFRSIRLIAQGRSVQFYLAEPEVRNQ